VVVVPGAGCRVNTHAMTESEAYAACDVESRLWDEMEVGG
jgi:hypothetical protein